MPIYKRQEKELFTSPFAAISKEMQSRVRRFRDDNFRTPFQRDIHRIIYSQAFRRLRHKTQVFFFPRNDHVCTRMEHVLHVASAARTVARCLCLNEDLTEAIALAHDIGHAPFGHIGEKVLNKIVRKGILTNFHHEIYGLRVVDTLAKLDREPPGLNLTWAVRDGIVSHCGEDFKNNKLEPSKLDKDLDSIKSRKDAGVPFTMEGCIVRMVDKIVYSGRDVEDAIATGVIKQSDIPKPIIRALGKNNGAMLGTFVEDLIENSFGRNYLSLSKSRARLLKKLIKFNYDHIYNSNIAKQYNNHAKRTLTSLFDILLIIIESTNRFSDGNPKRLNISHNSEVYKIFKQFVLKDMKSVYTIDTPNGLIVLDFIAGMTDNFAVRSFQELFVPQPMV